MDKALREITVGEWKSICDQRAKEIHEEVRWGAACNECPMSSVCAATPDEWELPEDTPTAVDDTPTVSGDTPTEGAKPRLAEVLGVAVNEEFGIKTHSGIKWDYHVENSGVLRVGIAMVPGDILCYAINHPESIIRAPRLTEEELERCRPYGAKWVTKSKNHMVELWGNKPEMNAYGAFITQDDNDEALAIVQEQFFPSVNPGDCICVEEAGVG